MRFTDPLEAFGWVPPFIKWAKSTMTIVPLSSLSVVFPELPRRGPRHPFPVIPFDYFVTDPLGVSHVERAHIVQRYWHPEHLRLCRCNNECAKRVALCRYITKSGCFNFSMHTRSRSVRSLLSILVNSYSMLLSRT